MSYLNSRTSTTPFDGNYLNTPDDVDTGFALDIDGNMLNGPIPLPRYPGGALFKRRYRRI